MTTSASPLRDALVARLRGDDPLKAVLGVPAVKPHAVFRGAAPLGVVRPYITVGTSAEDPFNLFGKFGNVGTDALHIWSDRPDDVEVLEIIYPHVERLLNRVTLSIAGYSLVRGTTRVVFVVPVIERGVTVQHGFIEYASMRVPV